MKKILTTLLIVLSFSVVKAETPVITLEYKYSNPIDTLHFENMKSDNDFCCNFVITSTEADSTNSDVVLLRHTETGVVLGKIYGKPTKQFILQICQTYGYLNKESVDKLAYQMLSNKNIKE